jgi:hypothetical protein
MINGNLRVLFPMFEEAAKQNVPLEIKYLSIVESALNPKAVSECATGLCNLCIKLENNTI